MMITCGDCGKQYDDVYRLTVCPHESFEMRTIVAGPEGVKGVARSVEELHRLMER